jgi:hypothetical protein
MSDCMLCMEAVLAWFCCMCPLLVAVERGRWFLINVVARPGMVGSSLLRSSARRSVDAGGEHMIWSMYWAYSAVEDVASMLAATAVVDNIRRGAWLVVADGLVAWTPTFVRGTIHKLVRVHLLPQIMV